MVKKKRGSCSDCCLSACNWLPVIVITLIVAWSYYAYVYSMCIVLVNGLPLKVCFLIFYHILLGMFGWSYAKVILEPANAIPLPFVLTADDWEQLNNVQLSEPERENFIKQLVISRKLPVNMVTSSDNINWCLTCGHIKPDRTHHCSTCGRCIMKMDHHCPWTNNCVGHHNHKYFVVFLAWGTIYCLYLMATSANYFGLFWSQINGITVNHFMVLFLFVVSLMFAICQASLGFYHIYLISRNQTTLETFSMPKFRNGLSDRRAFDMGCLKNFRETFGDNCCLAILPVKTTAGDGVLWYYRIPTLSSEDLECGSNPTSPLAPEKK